MTYEFLRVQIRDLLGTQGGGVLIWTPSWSVLDESRYDVYGSNGEPSGHDRSGCDRHVSLRSTGTTEFIAVGPETPCTHGLLKTQVTSMLAGQLVCARFLATIVTSLRFARGLRTFALARVRTRILLLSTVAASRFGSCLSAPVVLRPDFDALAELLDGDLVALQLQSVPFLGKTKWDAALRFRSACGSHPVGRLLFRFFLKRFMILSGLSQPS